MDLRLFIAVFLSILDLNGVELLALSKKESVLLRDLMAVDMLDISGSADIQAACPNKDTYCLPRMKCPDKNVIYNRETLRFILNELFQDRFGCGAFHPTWTYVCCSTLEKVEEKNWLPKHDLWFLPATDGSAAKNVDPSANFPVMPPWPGYKNSSSSANTTSPSSEKPITNDKKPSGEKQQSERSINMDQVPWMNSFQQPFSPMMNDPRMNPWAFNPNNFMMNQGNGGMFNSFPEPPWMQKSWAPPVMQPEWSEMILVFPDGSSQHTFRDPRKPPIFTGPLNSPMQAQQFPTSNSPLKQDTKHQIPPISPEVSSSSRSRRATDSKFKLPKATGGMWTGNQTKQTDAEGRAIMPKPNAQWGSPPGSGPVPVIPIPAAYNVNSDRCGLSAPTGINARVLSGRKPGSQFEAETSFGEFPWHVAVVNGETGDYLCAGTIISARFVLTVAHCVRKFQLTLLFVRVGDWDLSTTAEMFPSYDVEVNSVQIHEDFYAGNMQNDIAILQLKFPLDFAIMPHVGSACLPPSSDPIYSDCLMTGWGQQVSTSEAKGDTASFSRTLKQTSQTLVTSQFCEKSLRPFLGQFYQLPKKGFVCAYDKDGKDSCFGDGGGALACLVNAPNYPKPNQYHVVGLVSWGIGCGMPSVPSAYTAIWDYLDWIRAKVNPIDPYPTSNPDPLNRENANLPLPIMVRSNPVEAGPPASTTTPTTTTTMRTTTRPVTQPTLDFIDLAFRN